MLTAKATCTGCGAPLRLVPGQRVAICEYCNTSLVVTAPATAEGTATVTSAAIPKEAIAVVKEMVLAGRRADAITHYATVAAVPHADAEKAVDQLVLMDLFRLLRQAPINAFGFLLGFVKLAIGGGLAALGVSLALDGSPGYWILAGVGALIVVWAIAWFIPKIVSTLVTAFGARGRARVLKCTVLKHEYVKGGALVLVLFEVSPERGGAPFVDEEPLLLREESVQKLQPGNIVPVRYDEPGRKRVFPISPIEVVGRA